MDTALRSVIAKFSVVVDDSPLGRLDEKITKLKGNYGALAFIATSALAGAAAASYHFIEAASDATETQNKIEALFGKDGRNEIVAWSKTVETEMGRAEYSFQKGFSDFAAFLDPMNIGLDKTVEFSKQLAKLSVDLASFYNTSEKEAQMRLFSGISGETEAVRRLGIDISDTSLNELFNSADNPLAPGQPGVAPGARRNKGKGLASLTLQEKTILRYTKIMKDTAKVQGDAARTAGGWANTQKRLSDRVLKFSVHLGKLIEGPGVGFLNLLEGVVLTADKFVTKTKGMETALVMLAGSAVLWTAKWVAANGSLLRSYLPLLGTVAKLAAVFLILEDAWLFFTDDDAATATGKMVQAIEMIETPAKVVRDLFKDISYWVEQLPNQLRDSWIPGVGFVTRSVQALTGGPGFFDEVPKGEDAFGRGRMEARAKEARDARTLALQKDDMEAYVRNRRADQSIADSEKEFRQERAQWALANPGRLTQNDIDAGYGFQTAGMNTTGWAGGGKVTVAPVVNITINTPKVDAEEIKKHVGKKIDEAAQTSGAKLRRRATKE